MPDIPPACRPAVLVIQPERIAPLDLMETPLRRAGLDLVVARPYAGEDLPQGPFDGLIVLGGPMSSGDDDDHPWLAEVRDVMRAAVDDHRPTLGICLGAQLLARACGGRVALGEHGVEAGVAQIRLHPAAGKDPLFTALPDPFVAAELHGDAVSELPPGSTALGESVLYAHQAFRVGSAAWGVQFHPEVSVAGYTSWIPAFDDHDPETVERVRAGRPQLIAHEPALRRLAEALADRFAEIVHMARSG